MAALVTYPLNNIDYTAEDAALFHATRTTGIFAGDDFSFSVSGADNTVVLGPGLAWMRISKFAGQVAALKTQTNVDMGLPDATYPRIDHVVLQFDANKNTTEVVVKSGTAASSPLPPTRSTSEALYEIHLLQVYREPSATAITAKDVTDLRLSSAYCGLMADSVTQVDTAAINAQISALIAQLREDIAAVKAGTSFVMKSGDTMTGPLNVPAPTEAANAANKGYVDSKMIFITVRLPASGWSANQQTVAANAVTANAGIWPSPEPSDENYAAYTESGVRCIAQGAGTLTFKCEDVPEIDLTVNVAVRV